MPTIDCPNCNAQLKIRNADVGRNFRCPRCNGAVERAGLPAEPAREPRATEPLPSAGLPAAPASPPQVQDTITFFCSSCGNRIVAPLSASGRTGSCNSCGDPVAVPSNQAVGMFLDETGRHLPNGHHGRGRKKTTAGLFAILIGGLGIHKFYHGSWGWGVLYILFIWTFIPALVSLIEGIIYLTMDDAQYDTRYNDRIDSAFKW